MIKAGRLFLVPMLSMFLLFIPYVGVLLTMFVLYIWYSRNTKTIHSYFRGHNYEINDIEKKELQKLK